MNFIFDDLLVERQYDTGFPTLQEAAEAQGHNVQVVKYIPIAQLLTEEPAFEKNSCTLAYGSIQFCQVFEKRYAGIKQKNYTPGLYFNRLVKDWNLYATQYPREWLLNNDFVILPYGEVKRRYTGKFDPFFMKPVSGLKDFVGQVISDDSQFNGLGGYNHLTDDMLCVLSAPKQIKAEFRYVICRQRVITGSEYRWGNVLDVRVDTHENCDTLANLVAAHRWQPDFVYVCDIALTDSDIPKLIELNAFSSSGLYACDTNEIIAAVADAAMAEHSGAIYD